MMHLIKDIRREQASQIGRHMGYIQQKQKQTRNKSSNAAVTKTNKQILKRRGK